MSDRCWLFAFAACSAMSCRREPPPPTSSVPPVAMSSSPVIVTPGAPSVEPAAAETMGEVDAWDLQVSGKRLTVVVPRAGERALVVDPSLGEWSSLMVIREGDVTTVSDVPGVLTLTLTSGKSEATLTLGGAAAVRAPIRPHVTAATPTSAVIVPTLDGDADGPRVLGRHGPVTLAWSHGFLPAYPSLPPPTRAPGTPTIVPSPVAPTRVQGCVVRGARPGAAAGPLEEALREAFERETSAVCARHGGHAILEASYALVSFAGVNQLNGGRAPGPTDVIAMTLLHRATTDEGSTIDEAGYLVGLARAEVTSLRSLLAPNGASWLSREARTVAEVPKGLTPSLVIDASKGGLAGGPSTIDVVVDTLPYGLFLRSRRIGIGPRSVAAPAFVDGPLTRRMLAMVNVDY